MEKFPTSAGETIETPIMGVTKDGQTVYDRMDSHFHPEGGLTLETLKSAISTISTEDRPFIVETVQFDGVVGKDTCVEVGPEDEIVMVYRKKRMGLTPMVKNREPADCDTVRVIMCKDRDNNDRYTLVTAFVGGDSPREPWDPNISSDEERAESEEFWNTHALIYNEDLIDWERMK